MTTKDWERVSLPKTKLDEQPMESLVLRGMEVERAVFLNAAEVADREGRSGDAQALRISASNIESYLIDKGSFYNLDMSFERPGGEA